MSGGMFSLLREVALNATKSICIYRCAFCMYTDPSFTTAAISRCTEISMTNTKLRDGSASHKFLRCKRLVLKMENVLASTRSQQESVAPTDSTPTAVPVV